MPSKSVPLLMAGGRHQTRDVWDVLVSGRVMSVHEISEEVGLLPRQCAVNLWWLLSRGWLTEIRRGPHRYYVNTRHARWWAA